MQALGSRHFGGCRFSNGGELELCYQLACCCSLRFVDIYTLFICKGDPSIKVSYFASLGAGQLHM